MDTLQKTVLIAHTLIALLIIVLVLLQRGKGADAGAGFRRWRLGYRIWCPRLEQLLFTRDGGLRHGILCQQPDAGLPQQP